MRAYRGTPARDITVGYGILATLSKHFKTSVPLLEFEPGFRKRSGVYFSWWELIQIHVDRDWINTLLHEFTHHLKWVNYKHSGPSHGKVFGELLYQVVYFYYGGDVHRYSWECEYKFLRPIPHRMAIRERKLREKLQRLEKELERLT